MKLTYNQSKDLIIDRLIENVSTKKEIKNKILSNSLSKNETLFNAIIHECKNLYQREHTYPFVKQKLHYIGIKELESGWFFVRTLNTQGKFINANAIFKDVYCESKECHKTAYLFLIEHNLKNIKIISGTINPYRVGDGILHTICMFEKENMNLVFDGSNFLVMEKDLYYNLFNFKPEQSITRKEVLSDRYKMVSKDEELLKSNIPFKLAKVNSNITKHFKGLGFILYLYNRDGFIEESQKTNIKNFEKNNIVALQKLNTKCKETLGKDAIKF